MLTSVLTILQMPRHLLNGKKQQSNWTSNSFAPLITLELKGKNLGNPIQGAKNMTGR